MLRAQTERNLLVTGPPGCGKSTLIARLAGRLPVRARGFTTAEMRSALGQRVGFRITTLDGREGILAHKMLLRTGPRLGSYRINLEDLEEIGAAELEAALDDPSAGLLVVDEIARMELFSKRFRRAVLRALDSPKALLGAIQMRRDPFLDSIRNRGDTAIFALHRSSLASAEERIMSALLPLLS